MNLSHIESRLTGEDGAHLEPLERSLPGSARCVAEIGYVLAVMLAPDLTAGWTAAHPTSKALWVAAGVFALLGVVLLRPWAGDVRSHVATRVVLSAAVVGLVLTAFANRPRDLLENKPRIGVELANARPEPGDPPSIAGGLARITSVRAQSPAEGHLRVGDRIAAIDGKPLDQADAAGDVVRRAHDPTALRGPSTSFSVLRRRSSVEVRFALGPAQPAGSGRSFFFQLSARDLCLLAIALCILLSDGQRPRNIGLELRGAGRELAHGGVALLGTYAVHLAAALPLAAIAWTIGTGQSDTQQKSAFLGELVGWASQVRPWEIPIYMGLAGAFEEVVFRGFLITRLRRVVGRWSVALMVAAVLFGLGHLAQGVLGVLQTAVLGLWFGWVFLRRRRLESVIVAHAAFNTIMFAAMIFFLRSGLWERAQQLLGR